MIDSIYKLYPQVVRTVGDTAFDNNDNQVIYDIDKVTKHSAMHFCKAKAKQLIAATDWAALPDVGLKNAAEFVTYRGILRGLIITPVADPVWPTEPTPIWE